eukprot:GAHX01002805.1.p1 GENE.GAHX01002805.1~~GAHX01002805.1.p1  ORF type:complete len:164 (+),score=30.38 GAHX01002805.1:47-538(+)
MTKQKQGSKLNKEQMRARNLVYSRRFRANKAKLLNDLEDKIQNLETQNKELTLRIQTLEANRNSQTNHVLDPEQPALSSIDSPEGTTNYLLKSDKGRRSCLKMYMIMVLMFIIQNRNMGELNCMKHCSMNLGYLMDMNCKSLFDMIKDILKFSEDINKEPQPG